VSHSLHRYGTAESLERDFCIYSRAARGVNRDNCGDKLRKILAIYLSEKPVNFGSSHAGRSYLAGLDPEEYAKSLDSSYGVIANFDDREAVKGVLRKEKEAALGISVVVSGLIDEVRRIASEVGLKPHTATLSLGIHGKRSLLPEDEVLEITTMCGHSLVASRLARAVVAKVRSGRLSSHEGALLLARPCPCGIFNTARCAELLERRGAKAAIAGRGKGGERR
jgi:hypothetical protein